MSKATTDQGLWYREPRRDAGTREWELYRIEGQKKQTFIIASHDVVGTQIHYSNGRTRQCMGENCFCKKTGSRSREKGYVGSRATEGNRKLILELVPLVFEGLREAFTEHRTLRGMILQMWRTGKEKNSPVAYNLRPADQFTKQIELAPDVIPILKTIWGHTDPTPEEQKFQIAAQLDRLLHEEKNRDDRATGTHD